MNLNGKPSRLGVLLRQSSLSLLLTCLLPATDGAAAPLPDPSGATRQARFGQWGVETQHLAKSVTPGEDYYRYVNKGWLESSSIPDGFPFSGAFIDLMLRTEQQVKVIIDDLGKKPASKGSPAQQVADFHKSYIDIERRNALGITPLKGDLKAILERSTRSDLARRMGQPGSKSIVDVGVLPDSDNPDRYGLLAAQGGLGMPGRDYYLKPEEPYAGFRKAYADYIAKSFERAGIKGGQQKADAIVKFETALAEKHWTPAQSRDAVRNHHPIAVKQLSTYAPGFDWKAFLSGAGLTNVAQIDINTDTALRDSAAVFAKTPLATLRAYSAFHLLNTYAPYLSEEWENANFDFFSRTLAGVKDQRPRDIRAVNVLNRYMGEQLGKTYVERHFPPESKIKIDQLVHFLRLSLRDRIENASWMDEATRREAQTKLAAITTKIGYPDRWHDQSSIEIKPDDLVGNVKRVFVWQAADQRAQLKESARTWEWAMNPQVINAYYNPLRNEIVFPAAILQAPFFDPAADPAVNFGAIGMVIGHELGHAFDDQGSRYDAKGALRNWWSEASRAKFEQQANRLVAQYDQFSPLPGLNVKGRLTLGENIGDLSGITVAWHAYQKFVETEYAGKAPALDGFSGNQRFFLGFGQLWRGLYVDGFLRQQVLTNSTSPHEYRVNGVLRNFTPWYETYGVTPGQKMYLPENERVTVW